MTKSDVLYKDGHAVYSTSIPSMPDYFGENTAYAVTLAYVPEIGTFLEYQGKGYEILQTTTYQEKTDKGVIIVHVMTCLELNDEGDDAGNMPITLKSDMSGITVP